MSGRWRTGRKVGRTIYVQVGDEPSDDDVLIGVMDTPELARQAVDAINTARTPGPECPRCGHDAIHEHDAGGCIRGDCSLPHGGY